MSVKLILIIFIFLGLFTYFNSQGIDHFYSDKPDRHLTSISAHHKRKIKTERMIAVTTGGKEPESKYITKVTLL